MSLLFASAHASAETPENRDASNPGEVSAWIEAEPADAPIAFVGFVRTTLAVPVRYELTAEKQGPSGRSSTRQSGQLEVTPATPVRLSQLSLGSHRPEDRYMVTLTIYVGDRAVARDELRSP